MRKFLLGQRSSLFYWVVGLIGTPLFVVLLHSASYDLFIWTLRQPYVEGSAWPEMLVIYATYAALFVFYAMVYWGTYRKILNSRGAERAGLIFGLVGHGVVTVLVLLILKYLD